LSIMRRGISVVTRAAEGRERHCGYAAVMRRREAERATSRTAGTAAHYADERAERAMSA